MCKIKLVCGIELELEYNRKHFGNIRCADYHSDRDKEAFGNRWYCEHDGSLENEKFDGYCEETDENNGDCVEIISIPFLSTDYKRFLKSFENNVYKRVAIHYGITPQQAKRRYSMGDLINFNSTMGTHIHIGVLKEKENTKTTIIGRHQRYIFDGQRVDINNITTYKVLKNISETLLKKVHDNFSETFYSNWSEHFYRDMSKPIEEELDKSDRYTEWNFCNTNRLEFRSFNLLGVKNWEQFYKLFSLAFRTIESEFSKEFSKKMGFSEHKNITFNDISVRNFSGNRNLEWKKKEFRNHNFRYNVGCFENV